MQSVLPGCVPSDRSIVHNVARSCAMPGVLALADKVGHGRRPLLQWLVVAHRCRSVQLPHAQIVGLTLCSCMRRWGFWPHGRGCRGVLLTPLIRGGRWLHAAIAVAIGRGNACANLIDATHLCMTPGVMAPVRWWEWQGVSPDHSGCWWWRGVAAAFGSGMCTSWF